MKSLTQMLSLRMDEQKTEQLKTMLGICQELGAEIRYHPEYRYFTAMVWTGWDILLLVALQPALQFRL